MLIIKDIYPSIICANYLNLQEDLKKIKQIGCEYLHIDIMDGHFVPQITIGYEFIKWCKSCIDIKIDTHLMVSNPEFQIDNFLNISDSITFHYEATDNYFKILEKIKNNNIKSTIAIKPNTDLFALKDLINSDLLDMILIMSVEPGKYGQQFINESYNRISSLKEMINKLNKKIEIQIDGGINIDNIFKCHSLGVDKFVCGSTFFKNGDIKKNAFDLLKNFNHENDLIKIPQ